MGGGPVPLFAVVVALACIVDGRPQSHDQRSENFPVRPFQQPGRRENQQRTQESLPVRQFNQMDTSERRRQDPSEGLPVRPFSQSNHRDMISESPPVRPFNQANHREISPENLPVSPFSHSNSQSSQRVVAPVDSRAVRPVSQPERGVRQSPNSNVRVQQVSNTEDNPYQSRAHSAPPQIPHGSSGQHHGGQETQGHRQVQGSNQGPQERKKIGEETPNWSNGQVRLDPKAPPGSGTPKSDVRGHSGVQSPPTAPHLRENRRTSPQNQKPSSTRGQQGGKEGVPSVRMGAAEAPLEDKDQGKAEGTLNDAANPGNFDKEGIIFPGPTREGANNNPKVTPGKFVPPVGTTNPNCAKGSTFCESFEYYPSDYVKSVLKFEGETLKEFFGNDLLLNETDIVQRIDYQDENSLCPSKEDIVYPRMAQNKEDKWLYVVNQDQYVQGVRVETCLKPESECLLSESFPSGYKTICRQKFIYRKLLALNDDGKPHSDVFRLPSCCSCFVKSVSRRKRR